MNVLTQSPLPSAVMEISTGRGILAGSPIVATSFAAQVPAGSCLISQILDVNAAAVTAQFWPGASAQRISNGAPGTLRTWVGFLLLRSQTTTVEPKRFMASGSLTTSFRLRM